MIKKSKIIAIEKALIKIFPQFTLKKDLMIITPLRHILFAIDFHGSQYDDTSLVIEPFIMPLFVPCDFFTLDFSFRLKKEDGKSRWDSTMPDLVSEVANGFRDQALPFLDAVDSCLDFAIMTENYGEREEILRARAYALARAGETGRAIEVVDRLLSQSVPLYPHGFRVRDQLRELRFLLIDDPAAAQQHLAKVEVETTRALGLDDYRLASA